MLLVSIVVMFVILYPMYKTQLDITLIYIGLEIITFIGYPLYSIKICYIQIECSAIKATINKQISNTIRFMLSFIPTPFCTVIGQLVSMTYQLIYSNVVIRFKDKNKLIRKNEENRNI